MRKKRTRPIFFVCAGLSNQNELKTKAIQAPSTEEAFELFSNQFGFDPKDVLGPFYKKHTQVLTNTTKLVFSTVWKPAEYNDWLVSANILKEPQNHAFLLFKDRKDGKKIPKPQGTIIVPIYDLRLI